MACVLLKDRLASFYKGNSSGNGQGYSVMHSPHAFALDRERPLRAELYNPTVEAMVGITTFLLDDSEWEGK